MKYSDCFGKKSSRIVLGTAYFGDGISESDAFFMMDKFCALGGTHIDTARLYADGRAEEIVGRWRKSRKADDILISSKGAYYDPNMGESPRLSESDVRQDLEKSLKALNTECIDFYWLHRDDESKPAEEMIELLNRLVSEGKIKQFGASNWRAERIAEANTYAKKAGLKGFSASQIRFNPAASCGDERQGLVNMNEAEFAFYKQRNMPVVAYSSQAKGFFSKMAEVGESALSEKARKRYLTEENLTRLEFMKKLSVKYDASIAAIICGAFCSFDCPEVFPVIGGSNVRQIEDSMSGADVSIEKAELEEMFRMKL